MFTQIELAERYREIKKDIFQYSRGIVDHPLPGYIDDERIDISYNDGDAYKDFSEHIDHTSIEDGKDIPYTDDDSYLVCEYVLVKYEMSGDYAENIRLLEIMARSFTKEEYERLENNNAHRKEYHLYKGQEVYSQEDFDYYQGMNRIEPINNRKIQLLQTFYSEKEAVDCFEQYIFGTKREEIDSDGVPSYELTEYWIEAQYTRQYYIDDEGPITIGILNTSRSKEYEDRMEAERVIERTCLLERNITLETTTEGSYYKGVCREVGGNDERRVSVFKYFDTDEEALEAFQKYKDSTHVTNYDDTLQEIIEYSVERCVLHKHYWDEYIVGESHEVLALSDYTGKDI